jgi:hypothetical protein
LLGSGKSGPDPEISNPILEISNWTVRFQFSISVGQILLILVTFMIVEFGNLKTIRVARRSEWNAQMFVAKARHARPRECQKTDLQKLMQFKYMSSIASTSSRRSWAAVKSLDDRAQQLSIDVARRCQQPVHSAPSLA